MKWFSALLFLVAAQVSSAADLSLMPALRTYPFSASVEARARHELMIWDHRDEAFWKYGFLQPQVALAAHGLAEASLSFFPISILELTGAVGTTSRFYKTKPFNCDENVCEGILKRERISARLLLGAGDWIAVLSAHRIWASTQDDSKPFVDEVEVLSAHPGNDTFESGSLLLGKKIESDFAGVFLKQGHYLEAKTDNQFQYIVYKKALTSYSAMLGVGRYASDFTSAGLSVYAYMVWTWGKSQALY